MKTKVRIMEKATIEICHVESKSEGIRLKIIIIIKCN